MPELENCAGKRDARHAYGVLRSLTPSSGGMVAAATTSLPERADAGRNYDYRYVWIRDQCWSGQAVAAAGPYPLLQSAVRFVRERILEDGPYLRPVYTSSGGKVPGEKELGNLPGYPGAPKIVIGNRAGEQFQLDTFGEALLLFAAAVRQDCFDREDWRAAEAAAAAIEQRWTKEGAGVWEIKPRHWTHSRLICAAGLLEMADYAPREIAPRWRSLAETIISETKDHAVDKTGRWKRTWDDERVDAALLLPALRGAVDPEDALSLNTLKAVEEELTQDGYCYRFPTTRPLGETEGAFSICGYWLALSYLRLGRTVEAARWFERSRAACGPPGLFTEEFDVLQRELRGNLPQAFVHALFLECAAQLGKQVKVK